MSRMKKVIITMVSLIGSIAAFVSGLFLSYFMVGKKIDQAYGSKRNDKNDDKK